MPPSLCCSEVFQILFRDVNHLFRRRSSDLFFRLPFHYLSGRYTRTTPHYMFKSLYSLAFYEPVDCHHIFNACRRQAMNGWHTFLQISFSNAFSLWHLPWFMLHDRTRTSTSLLSWTIVFLFAFKRAVACKNVRITFLLFSFPVLARISRDQSLFAYSNNINECLRHVTLVYAHNRVAQTVNE